MEDTHNSHINVPKYIDIESDTDLLRKFNESITEAKAKRRNYVENVERQVWRLWHQQHGNLHYGQLIHLTRDYHLTTVEYERIRRSIRRKAKVRAWCTSWNKKSGKVGHQISIKYRYEKKDRAYYDSIQVRPNSKGAKIIRQEDGMTWWAYPNGQVWKEVHYWLRSYKELVTDLSRAPAKSFKITRWHVTAPSIAIPPGMKKRRFRWQTKHGVSDTTVVYGDHSDPSNPEIEHGKSTLRALEWDSPHDRMARFDRTIDLTPRIIKETHALFLGGRGTEIKGCAPIGTESGRMMFKHHGGVPTPGSYEEWLLHRKPRPKQSYYTRLRHMKTTGSVVVSCLPLLLILRLSHLSCMSGCLTILKRMSGVILLITMNIADNIYLTATIPPRRMVDSTFSASSPQPT